mgnify:CR=1 FL=1
MKSFKLKDLIISVTDLKERTQTGVLTELTAHVCYMGCSRLISQWCQMVNTKTYACRGATPITTILTAFTTTLGDRPDVEIFEELKYAKEWIAEMEKALEANYKPQTREELEMLEGKLNEALKEVNALQRQMKKSS